MTTVTACSMARDNDYILVRANAHYNAHYKGGITNAKTLGAEGTKTDLYVVNPQASDCPSAVFEWFKDTQLKVVAWVTMERRWAHKRHIPVYESEDGRYWVERDAVSLLKFLTDHDTSGIYD